eukprot:XP_011407388.1 PREDICTED: uncharacterized protein LOC105314735 [Amphimedon queenslandica]
MNIRKATISDIPAIDGMLMRCYSILLAPDYAPDMLASALPALGCAERGLIEDERYFVAEIDNAIVGSGGWSHRQLVTGNDTPGIAHLRRFGTDPDMLRRGIGRGLIERIALEAEKTERAEIHCTATLTAIPFYKAQGFRVLYRNSVEIKPGLHFPTAEMGRVRP